MGVIDEVKQKIDIVETINQYVQLTKSGKTFRAPCPFHSEKKPSFFVYPDRQTWHCFGACNTGGDVFSFVMKKEGLDFGEALKKLAEKAGVAIPDRTRSEAENQTREKIFQINQAAAVYFHNLLLNSPAALKARQYLVGRGLNEKSVADFLLGYSLASWDALKLYLKERGYSEAEIIAAGLLVRSEQSGNTFDRFRDQIMFPIADERGRVTGFGARVLDNSSPKYINSPQTPIFDKSGSLYGSHLARSAIHQQDLAILVEGYMDVIIAHQYGFQNVIAPMGIAVTEKQINKIKRMTRNIGLALDPDAAGEDAALRCIGYENTLDTEVKVISLPQGKDPDEVIKENPQAFKQLVASASPVIEFAISKITSKFDLKSTSGKTSAVNQILPIIAEVKAGPRQFEYLTSLAIAVGIDDKRLEAALGRYKQERKTRETRIQSLQKATRPIGANPLEEYLLTLILKHPEMEFAIIDIPLDYFENTENRTIFEKIRESGGSANIKNMVEPSIQEHIDILRSRDLPGDQIRERYNDCVLRLKERYLRNLQRKQSEMLALEAESNDKDSVHEKLRELGTDINVELKKIFEARVKGN